MKIKVALIFLVWFLINSIGFANPPSPSAQTVMNQSTANITDQISGIFQHNPLIVNLTKIQRGLNENIATKIKELKEQKNPSFLGSILVGSFIYGVFHALGPGHGKSIISSWIISKKRGMQDVLFISVFAAAFHALSAALIVGCTYVLLGKFAAVSTQQLNVYLQIAAAILVIIIGLGIIIRLGQSNFGKNNANSEQPTPGMLGGKPLVVALSIGLVPCPVTSVILIFCLTLGLIWQGILLVTAFAIGMGASLVAVSLLVWTLKEKITNKKWSVFQYAVDTLFPIIGGIFLIFMGSIILYSLL